MDEEEVLKRLRDAELKRREMARFAHDTIRVYNPLDKDFKFLHDGYPNTIKAHSYKDVERFKAMLYFKKISEYIIGEMQIKSGNELLKKRDDRGLDKILDKYQENRQIWDNVPKLSDEKLLSQIASDVIIGLVEEYGKEEGFKEEGDRELPKPEMSNTSELVFKQIANKRVSKDQELPTTPVKPLVKGVGDEQDKPSSK